MKDVVIKDIKRKTNLDRKVLKEAAILGYSTLVREISGTDIIVEEEEQKRRSQERVDKIRGLRNLSFNFTSLDPGNEFDQVPAYLRRDTDLNNSIANVKNFYSRAQVKKDDKGNAVSIKPSIESL